MADQAKASDQPSSRPGRWTEEMAHSAIQPALRNPKGHDGVSISASISRFGMGELPLLDERTGRLVAGHGRLEQLAALQAAGQAPPDGIAVHPDTGEWMVPVIRGWASRSDGDAEAYIIASNKLTMAGGWDTAGLTEMLTDLASVDMELFAVTGFQEDELAKLTAGPGSGGGEPPDDFPEYDEDIPTDHTCPSCGYRFSGGKGSGGDD